jgi:hypothetical protein
MHAEGYGYGRWFAALRSAHQAGKAQCRDHGHDAGYRGCRVSATYRIEIRRAPHSLMLPWDAVVIRLSDEKRMTVCVGKYVYQAIAAAREWVQDEEGTDATAAWDEPQTLYVDDQGRDAEAPQSVKVP